MSSKERGRGAVIMDCGGPLGAALGAIIIAYLIAVIGSWRIVFAIAGIFTLLFSYLAWRFLRDTPKEHQGVNNAELNLIESTTTHNNPSSESNETIKGLGIPCFSLAAILCGRAAWAMMFFGLLTWGPSYLAQARGFDLKGIGSATFIIFLCGSFGSLCGGFLSDSLIKRGVPQRFALKGVLTLSGLSTLTAFLILPTLSDAYVAVVVLSTAAFFLMWGSLYWSFPALLAPKSKVGIVGGTMNMAGSVGGITIPILVGFILQQTANYDHVLMFFAGCSVVYVLGTWLIKLSAQNR